MALGDNVRLARRLGLIDPRQIAATTAALARWGPNLASMYAAAAVRHRNRAAVVDHRGSLTYGELDHLSTRLAKGLRELGLKPGDHVGILCFNHRDFVEASVAAAKAGLPCVYLNTGFAAPQLTEVLAREGIRALFCDAELTPVADASGFATTGGPIIVTDCSHEGADNRAGADAERDADDDAGAGRSGIHTIDEVRGLASNRPLLASLPTQPILLTSGTTGTPKGARRHGRPSGLASAIGLLQRIPYRSGDVSVIPTPLFHAWGLSQVTIAAATGSTAVLVRRFDPAATLHAVEAERATVLAVVPIMLQRILAMTDSAPVAGTGASRSYDTRSLRIVASSGSALPAQVALDWMNAFGDNLYNMYGSTEVGQATLADPQDLRAAPGTAGRVVAGSTVEIIDEHGDALLAGKVGRIMVGNDAQFTEYTGGGTKETVRGLMSSGDVGYFDGAGRLFVTGRADDMIISGGENVFPQEVEELLLAHDDVVDAAVFGVPDAEFGQRLAALIVKRPGSSIDEAAVKALVAADLARHKVPRDVGFTDELPRNTTGKLLRNRLS